nr:hypothetical protein Iba_chr02dCG1240 [Ipomoea batatas]
MYKHSLRNQEYGLKRGNPNRVLGIYLLNIHIFRCISRALLQLNPVLVFLCIRDCCYGGRGGKGKSSQVSGCIAMSLAYVTTSSVTPTAPFVQLSSSSSSDPSCRIFDAIFVISDTALLLESLDIPLRNLPPSSAKSFRIPAGPTASDPP